MELYIARHGETEFNKARRWQGSGLDSPLTPLGIEQAKILGKKLEGIEFDAIYSSPLKRAMDTARIAFDDDMLFETRAETDIRLREIGLGDAEGMGYDEISEDFKDTYNSLMLDASSYVPPPNGETIPGIIERIDSFLKELATRPHERVYIQAHGYVMRIVYACAHDKSFATVDSSPRFGNCELWRYVHDGDRWSLAE